MKKFVPIKGNNDKVVISIRIDNKLLESIDKEAFKANISRNEFIFQCISYAISNMEEDNKFNK